MHEPPISAYHRTAQRGDVLHPRPRGASRLVHESSGVARLGEARRSRVQRLSVDLFARVVVRSGAAVGGLGGHLRAHRRRVISAVRIFDRDTAGRPASAWSEAAAQAGLNMLTFVDRVEDSPPQRPASGSVWLRDSLV